MPPNQIIQVTNIAPMATREQIRTLFGYLGRIEEMTMYPSIDSQDCPSKVCYIRFNDSENPLVAMHLNNTVFIDRALIVFPLDEEVHNIPDEIESRRVQAPANTTAGVLPKTAEWPYKVMSMVVGKPGDQSIQTVDHQLGELGLPPYPPLPATTDGNRIEEIRRTILVSNLHPDTTAQQVIDFFTPIAEVKFARLAAGTGPGSEGDERAAFVEFSEQASVARSFALMGGEVNGRQVMIQHAACAIIKPASHYGSSSLDDHRKLLSRRQSRSPSREKPASRTDSRRRSTSRSRRRSRSRGSKRHHRSRSRSRGRRRGRSGSRSRVARRSRSRGRRSRSRGRRSRSRGGRRSRSRGRRSRSRGKRSRSRGKRSRSRGKRSKSREKRRSRSKGRRSRSRSKEKRRANDKKKEEEKRKDRKHTKDRDRDKDRSKDKDKAREREKQEKEKAKEKEKEKEEEREERTAAKDSDSEPKAREESPVKAERLPTDEKERKEPPEEPPKPEPVVENVPLPMEESIPMPPPIPESYPPSDPPLPAYDAPVGATYEANSIPPMTVDISGIALPPTVKEERPDVLQEQAPTMQAVHPMDAAVDPSSGVKDDDDAMELSD